jgi:shikimate kinase
MMKNIVLIGMPSSGKSTTGKVISKKTNMSFIDTDLLIKQTEKRLLKDIVNTDGLKKFLEIQEREVLGINAENHVISTGGGVVYSAASMEHLKQNSIIVYLALEYEEIESRVTPERRFARLDGQSLLDIYNERKPLYEKYSDITIKCSGLSVEEIAEEIIEKTENLLD